MEKQNSSASPLNPIELEAVLKWVDSYQLTRYRKKLNRDFSDGVLLAEMLKSEFPSLVELHNYSGYFAVQGKIENWQMLNRKVLRKLEIPLKSDEIEKVAKAETCFIEEVLFRLMNQIKLVKSRSEEKLKTKLPEEKSSVMTIKVWKQIGDHAEQVPQRVIDYSMYQELESKCQQKEQKIQDLQETIVDLQCALNMKTQIIDDLNERLEKRQKKSNQVLSMTSIKDSITNLF